MKNNKIVGIYLASIGIILIVINLIEDGMIKNLLLGLMLIIILVFVYYMFKKEEKNKPKKKMKK